MTSNPLNAAHVFGPNSFSGMIPGESRTVDVPTRLDEKGRPDPNTRAPKTITRTSRPFIFDWVDSTNAELARKGSAFRWAFTDGPECPPQLRDKRFIK